MAEKTIRSHRSRVKQAKYILEHDEYFKKLRISIFDREAFVEFFLLEDVERLYCDIYASVRAHKKETREGIFYQKKQLEKIHYLIYMLKKCKEIMIGKIYDGAYSDVWKAIHERQIMTAAGKTKYLDSLIALTETMLRDVDNDALELAKKMLSANEFMDDLDAHDANIRSHFGIESAEEIDAVLDSIDVDVPQNKSKSKIIPN